MVLAMPLGIIAEDKSDVSVLRELTLTLLRPRKIGFKHFVGHGSGKLRRKCSAWAVNLVQAGCRWIVVIHDLDRNVEAKLRKELEAAIADVTVRSSIVLIPVQELEAWLMYDSNALRLAFNATSCPRLVRDPQLLTDAKKALRDVIWRTFKKKYVNTIHNEKIAKHINPRELRRSSSFEPFVPFVEKLKKQLK